MAYVVWLPLLNIQSPATLQRNAHRYEKLIPGNARVLHYADPEGYSGKAYGPVIKIPYGAPAWDVYFAFSAEAEWGEEGGPPTPDHWEHQLGGMPPERRLDGPRFSEQVKKLLAAIEE